MSQPFVIGMRAQFDASGVREGAEEATRHIREINTAASEAEREIKTRIHDTLSGGQSRPHDQAAADIAAYGTQLDALRAKYNPLYDAEQRHAKALQDIQRAYRVGAISSGEMSSAMERERTAHTRRVAELSSADRATRGLRGANDNLSASFRNTASSIAILHGPLGGIASRFSVMATLMDRVSLGGAAVAVGIGAGAFAAQRGVAAFSEYERQQLTTEQVIRATGMAAGRTSAQIEALSREIGMNTLASTNQVREAAMQLLTFRSVSEDTFDRAMRASQDLAAVGFGTVSSAASQLGRALEDPTNGLSQLRRVGVSFSPVQQQVIKDLVETGQQGEAMRLILEGIERQVGGAGVAAGGGLAGAWDGLTETVGIHLITVGEQIAEYLRLESVIKSITGLIAADNAVRGESDSDGARRRLADLEAALAVQEKLLEDNPQNAAMHKPFIDSYTKAIADLRAELQQFEGTEVFDQALASVSAQLAQRQAEIERIDSVVLGLDNEFEALQRNELAQRQYEEVRKAGVEAGSDEARMIEELVARNYALEEAKRGVGRGTDTATKAIEAQAKALAELVGSQSEEMSRLRLERTLVGASASERARQIALMDVQNDLRRIGIDLMSEEAARVRENALAIVDLTQELDALNEAYELGRSSFRTLFSEMKSGLDEGKNFWEALGNAALKVLDRINDRFLEMAADSAWNWIWNGFNQSGGGNWLGDIVSSILNPGRSVSTPSGSRASVSNGAGRSGVAWSEERTGYVAALPGAMATSSPSDDTGRQKQLRVEIYNQSGEPVEAQSATMREEGGIDIATIVIGAVRSAIANGELDGDFSAQFGLARKGY